MDVDKVEVKLSEFEDLKQKVSEYALSIQELLLENQTLREKLNNFEKGINAEDDVGKRRKVANAVVPVQPSWADEGLQNGHDFDESQSAAKFINSTSNVASQNVNEKINSNVASQNVNEKINSTSNFNMNKNNRSVTKKSVADRQMDNGNQVLNNQRKKIFQAINTNVLSVCKKIKETNCENFSVKQANIEAPVKITVNTESEVGIIRNVLKEANLSFHEFKWSDEKIKCFIIRGLVGVTENDLPDIKHQLLQNGLPDNIDLSLHITGFMRANANKLHNVPVKLFMPPNVDTNMLKNIKYLNHVVVRFDLFKAKSIIQCKNCQRFGHAASGCQHEHRCVKCGVNHYRDSCPRTRNPSHKLKCCNCGGEHTANNLGSCTYFQKQFGSTQSTSNTTNSAPDHAYVNVNNDRRRQGVSFASVVRQNASNNVKYNNINNNNVGVGSVVGGRGNLSDASKLDAIYQMVLNHEKLFAKLLGHD